MPRKKFHREKTSRTRQEKEKVKGLENTKGAARSIPIPRCSAARTGQKQEVLNPVPPLDPHVSKMNCQLPLHAHQQSWVTLQLPVVGRQRRDTAPGR